MERSVRLIEAIFAATLCRHLARAQTPPGVRRSEKLNIPGLAGSFGRWPRCSLVTDPRGYAPRSRLANGQNPRAIPGIFSSSKRLSPPPARSTPNRAAKTCAAFLAARRTSLRREPTGIPRSPTMAGGLNPNSEAGAAVLRQRIGAQGFEPPWQYYNLIQPSSAQSPAHPTAAQSHPLQLRSSG